MKTFYVNCIVKNSEEIKEYNYILEYKLKSSAKKAAKAEAIRQFNEDHKESAISVIVDEVYEVPSFDDYE